MTDVTQYLCPESYFGPKTHHLKPYAFQMRCAYCGKTEAALRLGILRYGGEKA